MNSASETLPHKAPRGRERAGALLPTLLVSLLLICAQLPLRAHGELDHARQELGAEQPSGHEGAEGILLGAAQEQDVAGPHCDASTPIRSYEIVAIEVDITLNRYLDHDPQGRMYVLAEELERVRAEEAQNAAARAGRSEPAVSPGLQGDAIQPLILRVNQGECLRITLRNDLEGEPVSLHLHGSSLYLADTGAAALAGEPDAVAPPGATVAYAWQVAADTPEGTHYFHSHGDTRLQTSHGLFGGVIVEPAESRYLDPLTGDELRSGWAAMIVHPDGDFREYALVYHEIGNERYRHLDRNGRLVPFVDPFTSAYKPGGRAINYRSEPFLNRLQLQRQIEGRFDRSLAYSSYAFGDPATPVARSYLGDPVKQRLLHGGSEVFHVHHVHGGSIRWRRQPTAEDSDFDLGLSKHPPLIPQASERIDSQSLGPSESFDVEHECGSGGCQQGAGDYLIHCHVAHHYLAGMWMIWRVYNTLQGNAVAQDDLPPLRPLPDRQEAVAPAVTSEGMLGISVDWLGQSVVITPENLGAWVEQQLPPAGKPRGYDASVFDWRREGSLYLGEAESDRGWPGFSPTNPGARPPIYFDPLTGKLAYPLLQPHLGQRPPFAPRHGPSPFLDPIWQGSELPVPGAGGPSSLCPEGTTPRNFTLHAITLPIALNQELGIIDPVGQLFVLKEQEEAVRADNTLRVPLAIRANAGEDCLDILFKSELEDTRESAFFSKVGLHIHFVQFDVQASDGVTTGFNYEQALRPFAVEGEALAIGTEAGQRALQLSAAERFQPGVLVGVGMDQDATFEIARIEEVQGDQLILAEPLRHPHAPGEIVSSEFLRYRWYPDVQFGTAYFHDHVDALTSWQHGLFGALIAEPPGSSYHHPRTGEELRSGPLADIHTDARVAADVVGSFRELVVFLQDDNPLTRLGDSSGSSLNLRVEPLAARQGDPARIFSSALHGDPETPVLEAYPGDPIVLRTLVGAANDVHTLHVDGHAFRFEPFSSASSPISTFHVGISERFDAVIPAAGGPLLLPGDYLYANGRIFKLREGSWGLIRVHDGDTASDLQPLPGREGVQAGRVQVCPEEAPRRIFEVVALELPLPMLDGEPGRVFALRQDRAALLAGAGPVEPLVLHINLGDCLLVRLGNELPEGSVSFHADRLIGDPLASLGLEVGRNPPQVVPPGETREYSYYAHPDIGTGVALVQDGGDPVGNPRLGLYGAVVVGPEGTNYTDPVTGEELTNRAGWRVDAHPPGGPSYRDFTIFLQDEDPVIGTAIMPYTEQVAGVVGLNYEREVLSLRLAGAGGPADVYRSDLHGDPATPVLEVFSGDPIRIHVLVPYSEQAHVFSLEELSWPLDPGMAGTTLVSSVQIGALEAITIELAGTPQPGTFVYGDHREPFREAGLWGLLKAYPVGEQRADLLPLPGGSRP